MNVRKNQVLHFSIVIGCAFLLIMPQLLMKSMVIGSDALFHFNRFYDTASQIEHGNVQYFAQLYGFQQTGRVVNALYGPFMSYLQGCLVLFTSSWFYYQIVSNFLLYLLAGFSMYAYLRRSSYQSSVAVCTSLIFMTTFSIQYWSVRQVFSSWGASLMPVCLIPLISIQKNQKFNALQVGFVVALMTQVHLFSALLLVMIYTFFCLNLFFTREVKKKKLFCSFCLSIGFFLLLTANIWYALLSIYATNDIVPPFVNRTMYLNTITKNSYYWLINPVILVLLIVIKGSYDLIKWKNYSRNDKLNSFVLLFFLCFSTNLIPCKFLSEQQILGVNTIQFSFRFFIPFTVLLLISITKIMNQSVRYSSKKNFYQWVTVISLIQTIFLSVNTCMKWQTDIPVKLGKHVFVQTNDLEELKQSFFFKDKKISLKLIQKSTPDYLPLTSSARGNKYEYYERYILETNDYFEKNVNGNSLFVVWEGTGDSNREIPVIIYRQTQVIYNGKPMDYDQLKLSPISTPIFSDANGQNILEIVYQEPPFFRALLMIALLTFGSYTCYLLYKVFVINRKFYLMKN